MLKLGLPIALLAFAIDQATKWWALDRLFGTDGITVTGFFDLVLGRNWGVTFGLLSDLPPWILMAFTLAVIVVLLVWMVRADNRAVAAALGLVVGGALGNWVDRLRHGAVTDFLDFHVAGWHWPAFNLADAAIVCGSAILVGWNLTSDSPRSRLETGAAGIQTRRGPGDPPHLT